MQVLLLKDVGKLGHVGDVVEVKIAYARNYLYPHAVATEPTAENMAAIAKEKKRAAADRARRLKEYESLAEMLTDVSVTIEAEANPEGTLYGSVGAKDIVAALEEMGHPVTSEQIALEAAIRTLDNRAVTIKFTDEITTQIKVWVVRAGEPHDAEPVEPVESDGADAHAGFQAEDE